MTEMRCSKIPHLRELASIAKSERGRTIRWLEENIPIDLQKLEVLTPLLLLNLMVEDSITEDFSKYFGIHLGRPYYSVDRMEALFKELEVAWADVIIVEIVEKQADEKNPQIPTRFLVRFSIVDK